jgi:uncharacterized protein
MSALELRTEEPLPAGSARAPSKATARTGAQVRSPARPHKRRWASAILVAFAAVACAGHSARTVQVRAALDANRPKEALRLINAELKVKSAKELPAKTSGDNSLLILDRSMILQQLEMYELSSRDLQVADKQIEMLDFSRGTVDEIGKYMFSDDTGPYKAPPYEKLLINTQNMVNYLVRGDLNGARIEARRLAVMQKYLSDSESKAISLIGPGSYLAGFTFEKSDRPQEALRYYDEALQYEAYPTLAPTIVDLAQEADYRTPRIDKILAKADTPTDEEVEHDEGELGEVLVVVNFGRVPALIAKRIPIGLALTYAATFMTPSKRATAQGLAAQGLVTWVNFPELGPSKGKYGHATVKVDYGTAAVTQANVDDAMNVTHAVRASWDEAKGAIVASAITRMITRVVVGQTTKKAIGGTWGAIAGLATQATMTAVDTPDTRSWSTLPARMAIGRVRLPPGTHQLMVTARGERRSFKVDVEEGGWEAVNLTVLR